MNRDELVASIDLIKASLSGRESGTITGALLGELIRKVTPELDLKQLYPTGQKVLSRFVKDHCTGFLVPLHKQGGDVLYSITSGENENTVADSSTGKYSSGISYDLWVTFARPNSPSSVFVDLESVELFVGFGNSAAIPGMKVKSVTPAELIEFRREFISALDPSQYDAAVYSSEGKYSDWLQHIRGCEGKLFNRWSVFRIRKLHDLFRSRLEELGADASQLQILSDVMHRSQESPPKKTVAKKDTVDLQSVKISTINRTAGLAIGDDGVLSSDELFRNIVVEAVKRMSLADIRLLNIPAGVFMDSLNVVINN